MLIQTNRGYVNSRFVRTIVERQYKDTEGHWHTDLRAVDDQDVTHSVLGELQIEWLAGSLKIIPATVPMNYLVACWDEESVVQWLRSPIVAWLVTLDGFPEPVAIGCPRAREDEGSFIELPDGTFIEATYEGGRFKTIEECADYATEMRQVQQRQRQKAAAKVPEDGEPA
jgi:hypothetical protein